MADENFEDEKITELNVATQSDDKPLMYVGPNIFKLGLERYTVYKGELPASVENAIDKIPEILNLIIPVDELMNFTAKILTPSSPERQYFSIVTRKIKEL